DRHSLENYLLHDMRARYTECAHYRDLTDTLVDRDSDQRRHEKKSNEEADASEYDCELPEIAKTQVDLIESGFSRNKICARVLLLDELDRGIEVRSFANTNHYER